MAPPVLLAMAIGLLVALDSSLGSYHPLWQLTLDYDLAHNYLWTATAFILSILLAAAASGREWLFRQRYRIAVFLLLVAPALGGLNLVRLDPPDLAVVMVALFWLAAALVEDQPVLIPRVVLALLFCLAWFAMGSVMSQGVYIFTSLPSIMSKLMAVFLLANLVTSPRDHDIALKALVVVAVISAVIAILSEGLYLLTGYAFTFDDRIDEQFKCFGWICMFRATALSPTPQLLGHLLVLGTGLALFMPLRAWLRLLVIAIIVGGAISTLSLGVVLTVGIILTLFPFFRWPSRYPLILIAYATLGWLAHASGLWAWAYNAANNLLLASYGANIRVWTYKGGTELIERNPVFGIGALRQIPGSMHFSTPHNAYLQITLELGLPAAILFVTLLGYLFVSCALIAARAPDERTRLWMRGLLLGYIGMLVHFMSEPLYTNNLPWTYMGLITAAIIIYGSGSNEKHLAALRQSTPRAQRMARTLLNTGQQP